MEYKLDMSMMFAMHDALRRELVQVTRIAALRDDDPGPLLRAALGWELFKKFLLVHHQTEDDVLWPALRAEVAGHSDRLALADALEAEHAVIEPLLTAIDAAAADPDYGYQRLGDITDELAIKLTAHLTHEENDGLALIDASLTPQQWQRFAQVHGERLDRRRIDVHALAAQRGQPADPQRGPGQVPPAAAGRLPRAVGARLRRPDHLARR